MVGRDHALIFEHLWRPATDARPWVFDHDSPAVEADDGRVPKLAIAEAAGRLATLLESQGTCAGDRCVVWLDKPLDVLVALAGLTAIGAVPVLISPALEIEMLVQVLAPIPPVARVITTATRLNSCSALKVRERSDDWGELVEESRGLEPRRTAVSLPRSAPYVVTHTSGTTGVNKLIEYSRDGADHNSYTQEVPAIIGQLRGYAALAVSPVHFRFVVGVLAALRRKVPLIVLADDDPDSVGRMLVRWQPTYLETHPNTFMKWEPLASTGALSSVRCFLATFDVIHPGTIRTLLGGTGHRLAMFIEIYGQSEVCSIAGRPHFKGFTGLITRRRKSRRLGGHLVGWIVPGHSWIRIADEHGLLVGPWTPGRIQVKATGRFSTYPNRPGAARENLTADGWWDTGDYGMKDRLGRLILLDRRVERLTAAPSAIALEDVLLERMPWLLEAVVLERDGALLPVVATRNGSFDQSHWLARTRDLDGIGPPVVLAEQEIPRTATGKVQRAVLSELISAKETAAAGDGEPIGAAG